MAKRFEIILPIGGHLIVLDRSTGIAKEMADPLDMDFWLHGAGEATHAQCMEAFCGDVSGKRKT